MMKNIDQNIERTLHALDGIERARAPHDFETELFQKLRTIPKWIKWFQYSVAALLLLGLINVLTALSISSDVSTYENADYMEDNLLVDTYYPIITYAEE